MTIRCLPIVSLLLVQTAEAPYSAQDLPTRVLTQGGLLAVVFVLLYFYRRDFMQQVTKKNETLEYLSSMIERNIAASEKVAAASSEQREAIRSLSQSVNAWEERRAAQSSSDIPHGPSR